MKNYADIQSSGSALCILVDGMGKPLHMRIFGNNSVQIHDLCRDEAANALLKYSSEVFAYKIHRFNIINDDFIPDKEPVISKTDLDKLLDVSMSKENGVQYYYTSPLRSYIDDLIRAVPQEHLWNHYGIKSDGIRNMEDVENCCISNSQLTWDVLQFNNYQEYNLIETPHGCWLFDCSSRGLEGMMAFSSFLDRNFFNPEIDFDKIIHSSAWIHGSKIPREIINCSPEYIADKVMLPGGHTNPENYFIRENTRVLDFSPTPENYRQTFIAGWSDVAVPNRSNDIATLLFIEQDGTAPDDCLNLFLRSAFADKYDKFTSEIANQKNANDKPANMEKLKTMATQIIAENGFDIRGRKQPHQLSVPSTQKTNDILHPKRRRSFFL